MKSKELSGCPESSKNHPVQDQADSDFLPAEESPAETPVRRKTRVVYYGDPDYYDHLPAHLQYLKELPFADGAFDFYPPSYEIEIADGGSSNSDAQEPDQAPNESSVE
jgi:hypothetical protein